MKKTIITLAIAGAATAASADYLSDLSISGTFDFETQYVFRAAKLAQQSFQPSVEFGYPIVGGDLYTGLWTNQPITKSDPGNEIDLYVGYAYPVTDIFTLDLGATYYWYPQAGGGFPNHTTEMYFGVSADVLLSPAVYFYYDFDLQQTVVEFSIGYSLELAEYIGTEGLSIDTGAYFGILNTGNTAGGAANTTGYDNGYVYGGVTCDLVYAFNENVSSSIGVRWSINNDGDGGNPTSQGPANSAIGWSDSSQVWFGATVGFAY